ncbi:MAG: tRNA (N(6)-L-threonylcarbamoyladenosine(37)-C(2))-methylthiotransferase MtaB [Bacteroidales bacterium]|nr:tRNA (N(6)-L-threonylcarbamoyladenosine(37)-C(2))-methylthiotransferase MtaB [Bacteroidales bacterium]
MKIAFTTLGCKLNYAETSTYERGFVAAGWEAVPWSSQADIYLINTCAVTETAEKKSRNLIRRAHRTAPEARIVVTGCYAQLRRDFLLSMDGVWKVFGADEKASLVKDVLSAEDRGPGRGWPEVSGPLSPAENPTFGAYSSGERTRSFLKVQDGCDNFCAYCTVPFARGRSRSIPICEAVRSAAEISAKGIKEIVLTGVNTGDFGRTGGESFLDLLKALNEVEGIERYRISSIEPNLLTDEIIDWIASGTKFQPHFHIPLQSGSDTLLKRVGRRYDTAQFAGRIDYVRSRMEGPGKLPVFFGIDVIVGLPGESEELFRETHDFLKNRIRPSYIHVFPYSRRPGTRAAQWPDQISEAVKQERVAVLEQLCKECHDAFTASCRGLSARVLWESACKDGKMGGYSDNYLRVERDFDPSRVNTLEEVVL